MQEIYSSNPPVVTGICDPNNSQAWNYEALKNALLGGTGSLFRGSPSQNKMGGGRDSTTTKATNKVMVKCFSLEGRVPFYNISLPSPTLFSKEVLTHPYPLLKHLLSKMAVPVCLLARRLKHFLPARRLLTKD